MLVSLEVHVNLSVVSFLCSSFACEVLGFVSYSYVNLYSVTGVFSVSSILIGFLLLASAFILVILVTGCPFSIGNSITSDTLPLSVVALRYTFFVATVAFFKVMVLPSFEITAKEVFLRVPFLASISYTSHVSSSLPSISLMHSLSKSITCFT